MTESSPSPTASAARLGADAVADPIDVLCVDDDPDQLAMLREGLERTDRIGVETVETSAAALDALVETDCVVSDFRMPGTDGLELLDAVRDRDSELPFVLWTSAPPEAVLEPLLSRRWTDYFEKDGELDTFALLARRISNLVDRRRDRTLARRARAALDVAGEAVAVARPDGRVQFATDAAGDRFGYAPDDLVGRDWRSLFTPAAAERLAAEAVPSVADGWRWTGTCRVAHRTGDSVTYRTRLVGLDDGALVIALDPPDSAD